MTPAGTIGVRGTKFDFYVAPDGTIAVCHARWFRPVLRRGRVCDTDAAVRLPDREAGPTPTVSRASRKTLQRWGTRKRCRS